MEEGHESLLPAKEGLEISKGTVYVTRTVTGWPELVDAWLVGGPEGVFAIWKEGSIICMARGDDGSWEECAQYHCWWLPGIIQALNEVNRVG